MRLARIKATAGGAVYPCLSRIVDGQTLVDDVAKEKMVSLLHPLARCCEVDILTYCIMANHFHVPERVPPFQTPYWVDV